jgi:hypothetical protein
MLAFIKALGAHKMKHVHRAPTRDSFDQQAAIYDRASHFGERRRDDGNIARKCVHCRLNLGARHSSQERIDLLEQDVHITIHGLKFARKFPDAPRTFNWLETPALGTERIDITLLASQAVRVQVNQCPRSASAKLKGGITRAG